MKAISIRQPWVWAIVHAGKRIENRPRRWNHRGEILLHASTTWDSGHEGWIEQTCGKRPDVLKIRRGGVVGIARIVDCVEQHKSPWFFGPFGIVLDSVRALPFAALRGALGLFEVSEAGLPEDTRQAIKAWRQDTERAAWVA